MKKEYKIVLTVFIFFAIFYFCIHINKPLYSRVLKETSISKNDKVKTCKQVTFEKNNYLIFGKYQNEPILWQVLNIDNNGKALLMSKYILCFKAFDASGKDERNHNDSDLSTLGSSNWKSSTIRQWLNSDKDKINYNHSPNKNNIYKGYNAYNNESGFLCKNNFNPDSINLIDDNGDRIFLLSKSELSKYLKPEQRKKQCTKSAILSNNSPYLTFSSQNVWYWTSSKISTNRTSVSTVTTTGSFYKSLAYDGTTGVCPALYLKNNIITTSGGDGSINNPYWISNEVHNGEK